LIGAVPKKIASKGGGTEEEEMKDKVQSNTEAAMKGIASKGG
jgi:hypothetical protein